MASSLIAKADVNKDFNEETATAVPIRNRPMLSTLRNPTSEFLNTTYTKGELQKYCSQLKLGGIWTTKDKLIEKLMLHYSGINRSPSPSRTSDNNNEIDNEDRGPAEILERFERFVRETNDNFYVINNTLVEKEREITELKTKVFLAEEKIKALQEALKRRITDCDGYEDASASSAKKTLLIGDSCLKEVRATDLQDDVVVRTLPEANMELLKSWISEQLNHPLHECIIYCGTQDLLEEGNIPVKILDDLGGVIAELKSKSSDINVKVCELAPGLKTNELADKIKLYNTKLNDWCNDNGVVLIKTENYFRLGTGDIDINCYNNLENAAYDSLSRIGAVRLLDAVSFACGGNLVRKDCRVLKYNSSKSVNGRRQPPAFRENVNGNHNSKYNRSGSHYSVFRHDESSSGRHEIPNKRNHFTYHTRSYNENRTRNKYVNQYSHRINTGVNVNRRGCYNCGEFNHRQSNCRYDHKIRCDYCHQYGHKSRLCSIIRSH